MRLQLARARAGRKSTLIDDTTSELEAAIGEVRDLARGVHPAILTEAGLAAALETLAERSPVPVRIDAHEARYRPAIEVTAFYDRVHDGRGAVGWLRGWPRAGAARRRRPRWWNAGAR